MKPIPDYHQITNDLFVWQGFDPSSKVDCASTAVRTPEGFVLIDPIRLEEQALARMVDDDRVAAILLTSGNHERASAYEKKRLDVPVLAPHGAEQDLTADRWVAGEETIFGVLRAVPLPGAGPGETAYLFGDVLILGDALVNLDGVGVLPEKYCSDAAQLVRSLRRLAELEFDTVCFAHGLPIVGGAKARVLAAIG